MDDMKEMKDHLATHMKYPATKQDIMKACNDMSHIPDEHKKLFRIPLGDIDALEAHYRKFHMLDDSDPRREQKKQALLKMQRTDIAKYLEDRAFDFGDATHFREMVGGLQVLARLGLTTPGFVLYVRAKIGLYNLFHQLGARVNCHKVFRKYV